MWNIQECDFGRGEDGVRMYEEDIHWALLVGIKLLGTRLRDASEMQSSMGLAELC